MSEQKSDHYPSTNATQEAAPSIPVFTAEEWQALARKSMDEIKADPGLLKGLTLGQSEAPIRIVYPDGVEMTKYVVTDESDFGTNVKNPEARDRAAPNHVVKGMGASAVEAVSLGVQLEQPAEAGEGDAEVAGEVDDTAHEGKIAVPEVDGDADTTQEVVGASAANGTESLEIVEEISEEAKDLAEPSAVNDLTPDPHPKQTIAEALGAPADAGAESTAEVETNKEPADEVAMKREYDQAVEEITKEIVPILESVSLIPQFNRVNEAIDMAIAGMQRGRVDDVDIRNAIQALQTAASDFQEQLRSVANRTNEVIGSPAALTIEHSMGNSTDTEQKGRLQPVADEVNALRTEADLLQTNGVALLDNVAGGYNGLMSGLTTAMEHGDFSFLRSALRTLETDYYTYFNPLMAKSLQAFYDARTRVMSQ